MTNDDEIEPQYRENLRMVAQAIDETINGPIDPKKMGSLRKHGFIVAFFAMGDHGRFNYMSNCKREDIVVLLKEMTKRFEGYPEPPKGRA